LCSTYAWPTAANYTAYTVNPPVWMGPYSNKNYSAAAAAAAAAVGAAPANPQVIFAGATPAEVAAQNAATAFNTGATIPTQLVPYKPAAGQQFWCKELDQSWTLRTYGDVAMGELSPGHWEVSKTGYHYWVRDLPV